MIQFNIIISSLYYNYIRLHFRRRERFHYIKIFFRNICKFCSPVTNPVFRRICQGNLEVIFRPSTVILGFVSNELN
jgi:hypothetical protein